ncbi:MAG: STAS domain-containing protein [Solirubrobacteraceae bacterium]
MQESVRKGSWLGCAEWSTFGRFRYIVDFDPKPSVLRCAGEEVRTTQGCRRQAMVRAIGANGDVVVDLSELVFADTSLMIDLAMLSRRLRRRGCALLLHRPQPQIRTLIEMVGLHRLPGVRLEGPSPALA